MKSFYAEAFKLSLRAQTVKDVAGLDAAVCGFCRPGTGDIPKGLAGSAKMKEHVYVPTALKPTEWWKRSENINTLASFQAALKAVRSDVGLTSFYSPTAPLDYVLRFEPHAEGVTATQYDMHEGFDHVPWGVGDAAAQSVSTNTATDRTGEYFIFVCAHRARDDRCGYCGPILVDAMQQALEASGVTHAHVFPCTHVGGHIYAGNVLVYGPQQAVSYGLFTPDDVQALVEAIKSGSGEVPVSLRNRVRGSMGKKQSIS